MFSAPDKSISFEGPLETVPILPNYCAFCAEVQGF